MSTNLYLSPNIQAQLQPFVRRQRDKLNVTTFDRTDETLKLSGDDHYH